MAVFPMQARQQSVSPIGASGGLTQQQQQQFIAQQNTQRDQTVNGRYTAPQLYDSRNVDFANSTEYIVQSPLFLEKPHERLTVEVLFRMVIGVADYTTVLPEAPQNILKQIKMWGNASGAFGSQTMWQISGATLFAMSHALPGSSSGSYVEVNGVRIAGPGMPFLPAMSGAQGTYDIRIVYQLPTAPYVTRGISSMRQLKRYTLSPQDWGNTVRVQAAFGDRTSFGTPAGGTTVTITGFGSGGGLPTVNMYQNFAVLGRQSAGDTRTNGLVIRVERAFQQFVSQATQARIADLDQRITTGVLVKSGTQITSATGVTSFDTLTNAQLANTKIVHGTTPVRDNKGNESYRAYYADMFGLDVIPEGYLPIWFTEIGNIRNAYRADALEGGAQFYLASDVLTTGAGQVQSIVQEEIVQGQAGGPFGPVTVI